MAANYSTNPKNPMNQQGGQMQGQGVIYPNQMPKEPRSIKEYHQLAQSMGGAPSYTNIPGNPGMQVGESVPPSVMDSSGNAIPDPNQLSDYDKIPRAQRMNMNPFTRAQERVQDFLPELWNTIFPGYEQGAILTEEEHNRWMGAVQKLTSDLVKRYDKQSGKLEKIRGKMGEERRGLERYWQKQYVKARQEGMPFMQEDGMTPMDEVGFIRERMSAYDQARLEEEDEREQAGISVPGQTDTRGATPGMVRRAIEKNPELKQRILMSAVQKLNRIAGRELSMDEIRSAAGGGQYVNQWNEAVEEAAQEYQDQILKYQ